MYLTIHSTSIAPDGQYLTLKGKAIERCGQGKFSYTDGTVFEGAWKKDKLSGDGKFHNLAQWAWSLLTPASAYKSDWLDHAKCTVSTYHIPSISGKHYVYPVYATERQQGMSHDDAVCKPPPSLGPMYMSKIVFLWVSMPHDDTA